MSNPNNMTKDNLAATRVIQKIDAVRRQNIAEAQKVKWFKVMYNWCMKKVTK